MIHKTFDPVPWLERTFGRVPPLREGALPLTEEHVGDLIAEYGIAAVWRYYTDEPFPKIKETP